MYNRILGLVAALGLAALPLTQAQASGYAIGQESVGGMGNAYAGGAARAADPSTIQYNPAGMTRLKGNSLSAGGHLILPTIDYDDESSRLATGGQISGDEGGQGGQEALIPSIYGVYSQSNDLKFGVGLNSPFGLVTDYNLEWLGRYSEITTSVKTINFNAAAAYRISPQVSVGVGLNTQYNVAKLQQAVDFATICASLGGNCGVPGANDGGAKVTGDAFGFGFNLGVLYEPNSRTRFGAHYRSRITYDVKGQVDFDTPANAQAFFAGAGIPSAFTDTNARLTLVIPEIGSLSAFHQLDDRWSIMGDITWTRWGVFPELRIDFDNATPATLLLTQWKNVFRYSAAANYKWSDKLLLRGGLAFDDSPIPGDQRGPGIPDSDHITLAVGLRYEFSDRLSMDAGYQHLFYKTGNTRRISGTSSVLSGNFNIAVDAVGVAFNWNF